MTTEELYKKLTHDIPLTRHLGFEIIEATPYKVRLKARLQENINHKGTGFGGSLYTLSVLAAYSLVYLGLDRENIKTNNIVIQKGEIKYLKPVTADFEVVCEFSKPELYQKFFYCLDRWKKVRELLKVEVRCKGEVCARLDGVFVVHL
jgi:thioesterase domain-containing protein